MNIEKIRNELYGMINRINKVQRYDSLNEAKDTYFERDKNKEKDNNSHSIHFKNVNTKEELLKILKDTNTDSKENGFWLFQKSINKDKYYLNLNDINYIVLYDNDEIVGLMSYWLNYDIDYYSPCIRIADIQTLPGKHGYCKYYIDEIEKIGRNHNKSYITLMCYEPALKSLYEKYGFIMSDKLHNTMYKKIK